MFSPLSLLCLVAVIVCSALYHYVIYPALLSPLAQIPNAHPSAPFSGLWVRRCRRGRATAARAIYPVHKRLGPVIRLAPDEVSVASLDGLRQIYSAGLDKTSWYATMFANYRGTLNLVSMRSAHAHAARKRLLAPIFANSYVQASPDLRRLATVLLFERFLPLLRTAADAAAPLDVYELNQALCMDLTSAYLFGLENGTDFVRDGATRRKHLRNIQLKMKGLPGHEQATADFEAYVFALCQATENWLRAPATESPVSTYPVVYSQFSERLSNIASQPPSMEVASEMFDQLIASQIGPRVTLTYLFWELSRRPALQSALRNELMGLDPPLTCAPSQVPTERNPRPLPTAATIDALPLLHAVLQETLRLYPPSPAFLQRLVPPEGAVIEGYALPAGTKVGTSAYCMHRNERVWYSASEWRPERWLPQDDAAKVVDDSKRWFWAFGSGPRMCLGIHFAMHTMKLTAAAIYTNFTTSIVDDAGIEPSDGFIADPIGEKLVLRFLRAGTPAPNSGFAGTMGGTLCLGLGRGYGRRGRAHDVFFSMMA